DRMTYKEERAAERAAELEKPFLPLQELHKEHNYRAWLLDPVIHHDKLKTTAKLPVKMRQEAGRREPFDPVCPACHDRTGSNHFAHCCQWMHDVEDDPSLAPKRATHA